MKLLGKSDFKYKAEKLFDIALNSISGCKIKVGDKLYSLWSENGVVRKKEINIEFELSEEEFEKLNTRDD
jgi:hypothetical protein